MEHLDRYETSSGLGVDFCDGRHALPFGANLQLDGLRADDDFVMHLKVILVGQKGAGKTALAMRFCKNTFEESYKATLGVDFLTKRYYAFGVPCEVNVWDTAGEERFQAVSRAYYRGAGAAIVCFDLNDRASFDKVRPECANPWVFACGSQTSHHVLQIVCGSPQESCLLCSTTTL